jgi:hypothetical protein
MTQIFQLVATHAFHCQNLFKLLNTWLFFDYYDDNDLPQSLKIIGRPANVMFTESRGYVNGGQ